jgi:ribonucleoside-triphosphate reductase
MAHFSLPQKHKMQEEKERLVGYLEKKLSQMDLPAEQIDKIVTDLEEKIETYKVSINGNQQIPLQNILRVIKEQEKGEKDTTDMSLMVATTKEGLILEWDREKIVKALMAEADLPKNEATDIAFGVEEKVFSSGVKTISVSLIRELVDNELFERGYRKKLHKQESLGIPNYDLNRIIFSKTKENANVNTNNPEAVNLAIAETILKQYAFKNIFSSEVVNAHLKGALHLHDLGYPIRVYCSAHSLEYLKKYGLRLMNLSTESTPPTHAMTLVGHLNTFLASMQTFYAGALGIGYINIFFAPLTHELDDNQLKQIAQYLIFSCSQNAFSRGGQTLFIDFNVHLGVPSYLRNVPAIGPKGKYMLRGANGQIKFLDDVPRDKNGNLKQPKKGKILTYQDFEKESQRVLKAFMDVWRAGDSKGRPFPFPKMDLHINQDSFDKAEQLRLFKYACQIASENGSPYFVFDRDEVTLSACCRLRTQVRDNYVINHPESMRFCGFQNVTINLPQTAYKAGVGNIDGAISEIKKIMDLAIKAHLEKKKFIESIMNEEGLPLWGVGKPASDGRAYIDLNREDTSYIIGMIGLNEFVKYLSGKELHESPEAYKLGLKIISTMYLKAQEYEKKYGLNVKLEESPAESTSLRLAKVDLQEYPDEAWGMVRGDKKSGEIYYTNSIHFAPDAPIDIIERIIGQGKFHSLIESGAITHVFLGEQSPSAGSIFNLIKKVWQDTQTAQITISPEFTYCEDCGKLSRGFMRN